MKASLTIQEKLKDLRVACGLTLEELAEQTGLSKSALGNYETDENKDIGHYSIVTLAKFYGVSTDYLLGFTENQAPSNVELSDLHLSDELIELLKNGKINTRLLCEMAAHDDFVKLLADIEIYVDGIASMQIQNLNALVSMARDKVMAEYQPGKDDPHIRLLDAVQIKEDDYFRHMVHDDMDGIIRDIRQAHKSDSGSAADTSVVEEMKKSMEAAANFEGSRQEKELIVFCEHLGIDYKKLTPDEFRVMVQVLQKSKHLKSPVRQRGKSATKKKK